MEEAHKLCNQYFGIYETRIAVEPGKIIVYGRLYNAITRTETLLGVFDMVERVLDDFTCTPI